MSNGDEEGATIESQKKGRSRMTIYLAVAAAVVLVVAIGGGGYFMFSGGSSKPASSAVVKVAPQGPPQFLALNPPFVVNFEGSGQARFLQVGVQLMAYDSKALEVVKTDQPVVRNALIMLFSDQKEQDLLSRAGKEKLRAEALAAVQRIVKQRYKGPGIKALYFTSFVMQ